MLHAHKAHIMEWDPCIHGWTLEKESGRLVPPWFEGKQVPQDLYIEEENNQNDQDENDNEHGFKRAHDSDDDMDNCNSESDGE